MAKFYVTTPIYYANAKPHVGSAYTTVAADVLARWHRQQGRDVHFLAGLAEHGTKISTSAQAAGKTPQVFVDENAEQFLTAWKQLAISYDDFIRTTEKRHEVAVTQFFEQLKESGKIYEGDYEGLYCVGHEAFVKESDLDEKGNCPDHGMPPEKVKEKNWFFKLSDYADELTRKIESDEFVIAPKTRKNEVLSFITQGLEDIAISRQTVDWAIPIPWDTSQTIYVWLDELFNYCSAIGYGKDEKLFRKFWPADIHIIGKDIIKFHCIIWPALLMAIGEPLPHKVFAHGFFTVDGKKISKSLGNAIDPVAITKEYSADVLRYYLLREIPFGSDGDFSQARLHERYNADLANGLGNLVSRTLNMAQQFTPDISVDPAALPIDLDKHASDSAAHLENLAFDKSLATLWEIVTWADRLIEQTKPWELAKAGDTDNVRHILGQLLAAISVVNTGIAPFLPETHKKLTALLTAQPLKKPEQPLFARKA